MPSKSVTTEEYLKVLQYKPYCWESEASINGELSYNHPGTSDVPDNITGFSRGCINSISPLEKICDTGKVSGLHIMELGSRMNREDSLRHRIQKLKEKPDWRKANGYGDSKTSRIKWLENEADAIKESRLKGKLIDISVMEGVYPLKPFVEYLEQTCLKKSVGLPENPHVTLPNKTTRFFDIVLESNGYSEKVIKKMDIQEQAKVVKDCLRQDNFIGKALDYVSKYREADILRIVQL